MVEAAPPSTPPAASPDERGPDGARRAALRYLGLAEAVVTMDEAAAEQAQRAAATDGAADGLVVKLRQDLAILHRSFPVGPVRYRVAPLATRVTGDGVDRVVAEVLYVGVLTAPALPSFEEWRVSRYELVWERDGWRVASEQSKPTPRPIAAVGNPPAGPGALEATLEGFSSVVGSQ